MNFKARIQDFASHSYNVEKMMRFLVNFGKVFATCWLWLFYNRDYVRFCDVLNSSNKNKRYLYT